MSEIAATIEQRVRDLAEQMIDRIASDPEFRKDLLENPEEAMERAGFAEEAAALMPAFGVDDGDEVSGFGMTGLAPRVNYRPTFIIAGSTATVCCPSTGMVSSPIQQGQIKKQ